MQSHADTSNALLQQVGVQGVKLATLVIIGGLGHAHLGSGAVVQGSLQAICVDDGAGANVHDPSHNEQSDPAEHNEQGIPIVAVVVVTGAFGVHRVATVAPGAGVGAIRFALSAAVDDAGPANASARAVQRPCYMLICKRAQLQAVASQQPMPLNMRMIQQHLSTVCGALWVAILLSCPSLCQESAQTCSLPCMPWVLLPHTRSCSPHHLHDHRHKPGTPPQQ